MRRHEDILSISVLLHYYIFFRLPTKIKMITKHYMIGIVGFLWAELTQILVIIRNIK